MTSSTPTTAKTVPILLSDRWSQTQYLCLLGVYLVSENSGYYSGDHRAVDDLTRRPIENWTPTIGDDTNAWDEASASLTSRCAMKICQGDLREQLHYLLDSLGRISGGDYTQMVERNTRKKSHPNPRFTTQANFLAIGMCIGVYVSAMPDRPREPGPGGRWQVDFEGLATVLNCCPAFSGMNIVATQVKRRIEDIWSILEEGNPTSLLPPPLIQKRRSTEELTPVRSKQTKPDWVL